MASSPSSRVVRLALLGAGGMANTHAKNFTAIRSCRLVAVVEPVAEKRAAFQQAHGIAAGFATVDELFASDVAFDAVSVVTPDASHAPLSIRCARAGKHVLCEKPLALNHRDARRMLAVAQQAGVIHMVNLSYRNWPCLEAVARLVQRGELGEIFHVEASYLQSWLTNTLWGDWRTSPTWLWRLSTQHGSKGVLGDIGVHIVDFATYPAGPIRKVFAQLRAFPKAPGDRVGDYPLDANDSATLSVEFANGAIGTIHTTRWSSGHVNRLFLKISGARGAVEIDSERDVNSFRLCAGKDLRRATWKTVPAPAVPNIHQRFIASIRSGRNAQPDFARGAEVQRVLDASFDSDRRGRPVTLD